jgi:nucleotide-binding universal stress UspA family protein
MKFITQTPEALATLQEQAQKSGADELSLEDIEKEIQMVREFEPWEREILDGFEQGEFERVPSLEKENSKYRKLFLKNLDR